MKFSDIEQSKWTTLKPYLDTAILPVTGLDGRETPDEATSKLEQLRDWLDPVEQQFNGRVVTYPAYHFIGAEPPVQALDDVISNLKEQGFKYVVAVSAKAQPFLLHASFDAVFMAEDEQDQPIYEKAMLIITSMWAKEKVKISYV